MADTSFKPIISVIADDLDTPISQASLVITTRSDDGTFRTVAGGLVALGGGADGDEPAGAKTTNGTAEGARHAHKTACLALTMFGAEDGAKVLSTDTSSEELHAISIRSFERAIKDTILGR